jgi:hypothetical protein
MRNLQLKKLSALRLRIAHCPLRIEKTITISQLPIRNLQWPIEKALRFWQRAFSFTGL